MALAVDATSSSSGASVNSLTWSHTCSGSDRVLVVTVGVFGGQTVTGITYNGVALTQVGTDIQGSYCLSDVWKLSAPATGANNIVVSLSGTCAAIRAGGISFTGASGVVDGFASSKGTASGSTVNASVNVTSSTGNKVVGIVLSQFNSSNFTIGAGQTNIFEIEAGTRPCASSYEDGSATTAFSYTINSTQAGENYIIAGANVEQKQSVSFTISDTATLSDSFLSSLDAKLTDTLTLIESVLMSRGIPFTVEDYVTALDTIKLDMDLTVQDLVSMSDEQLLRLMWESITRITNTSWSSRTKPTTNWTSITRK